MSLFSRLFRRSPPVIDQSEAALLQLLDQLRARGVVVVTGGAPAAATIAEAAKPPHEERWRELPTSWTRWRENMDTSADLMKEGWTACRFANRLGLSDHVGWVFGVAKGAFGVWLNNYRVCDLGESGTAVLAAITHIPSGMGMGLFEDRELAVQAVNLIASMAEWHSTPPMDDNPVNKTEWQRLMSVAQRSWEFNSIDCNLERHAHIGPIDRPDAEMPEDQYPIWSRVEAEMPKRKEFNA